MAREPKNGNGGSSNADDTSKLAAEESAEETAEIEPRAQNITSSRGNTAGSVGGRSRYLARTR